MFYQYYCDNANEEERKNIHDWKEIFDRIKGGNTTWCTSLYQFHNKFKQLKEEILEKKYKMYVNFSDFEGINELLEGYTERDLPTISRILVDDLVENQMQRRLEYVN